MQLLFHLQLSLQCCVLLLSSVLSIQCKEEEYAWPFDKPTKCCAKCPPGHFMAQDPDNSCSNKCEACKGNRYMEIYNVRTHCHVCDTCSNPNMERKKNCTTIQNTECGCKAGYQCQDHQACTVCVKIPSTSLKPTTAFPSEPKSIPRDMMWLLVIITLLIGVFAGVVATKIKPFLQWITGKYGFVPVKNPEPQKEKVAKPIQEAHSTWEASAFALSANSIAACGDGGTHEEF